MTRSPYRAPRHPHRQLADTGAGRKYACAARPRDPQRAVNKGGRIVGQGMTAQSVFETVEQYGRRIGMEIAPHDLRRTFAKLAHKGHAALEQIQISLGHASIQTTERYLGIEQDLTDAPCDHLGLRV